MTEPKHKTVEKEDKTVENHKKTENSTGIEKEDSALKPISRISLSAKKKSKTISISAAFDQLNQKKEDKIGISKLRETDFSATQMLKIWKEVITFVKQKGKSNLGITLGMFPAELKENFVIELPLSNSSQAEMLIEEKDMILEFLRNKLENDYIFIKADYENVKVNLEEIKYIQGLKDYLKVHVDGTNKPILTLMSFKELLSKLPEKNFVRIHRSFVINVPFVKTIQKNKVVIDDIRIPIGESYKEEFYNRLGIK